MALADGEIKVRKEREQSSQSVVVSKVRRTCEDCGYKDTKTFDPIKDYFDFHMNWVDSEENKCPKCGSRLLALPADNLSRGARVERHKEVIAYKYSGNGKYNLYESIILNGFPYFVMYDEEKEKLIIKPEIGEPNRIIRPPTIEECPFPAYEFESEEELDTILKRTKEIESIEELYRKCKNLWTLYIDQEAEIITMLAADSILTYFQDLFSIIHYSEAVGGNDTGKSSIGYTFEYTGYRVVKASSITGANYLRIFGTVEPGQCAIIEDEGDDISDDQDKIRVLKIGYEYNAKIPRINMNTKIKNKFGITYMVIK